MANEGEFTSGGVTRVTELPTANVGLEGIIFYLIADNGGNDKGFYTIKDDGIGGYEWRFDPESADDLQYDNTTSGLTATNTQAAIDEVEGRVDSLETDTHTHSNKAVLDATTASYTTTEESKLSGIEAGAEVNRAIATQSEAETGTDDTVVMTPLKDRQVMDLIVGDLTSAFNYETPGLNYLSNANNTNAPVVDVSDTADPLTAFDGLPTGWSASGGDASYVYREFDPGPYSVNNIKLINLSSFGSFLEFRLYGLTAAGGGGTEGNWDLLPITIVDDPSGVFVTTANGIIKTGTHGGGWGTDHTVEVSVGGGSYYGLRLSCDGSIRIGEFEQVAVVFNIVESINDLNSSLPDSLADLTYDNSSSGLTATDGQAAIDELDGRIDTLEGVSHSHSNQAILDATTASFTTSDETKLDAIEPNATADQSDAEIETAYNSQVSVVDQPTAEAGISTSVFRWTPERVSQAISALAPSPPSATETVEGLVELSTQAEAEAGINDTTAMTPLKSKQIVDFNDYQVLDLSLDAANVNVADAPGYNSEFKKLYVRLIGSISQNTTVTLPDLTTAGQRIIIKDAQDNGQSNPEYSLKIIPGASTALESNQGLTDEYEIFEDGQVQEFYGLFDPIAGLVVNDGFDSGVPPWLAHHLGSGTDPDLSVSSGQMTIGNSSGKPMVYQEVTVPTNTEITWKVEVVSSTAPSLIRIGTTIGGAELGEVSVPVGITTGTFNTAANTTIYLGVYVNATGVSQTGVYEFIGFEAKDPEWEAITHADGGFTALEQKVSDLEISSEYIADEITLEKVVSVEPTTLSTADNLAEINTEEPWGFDFNSIEAAPVNGVFSFDNTVAGSLGTLTPTNATLAPISAGKKYYIQDGDTLLSFDSSGSDADFDLSSVLEGTLEDGREVYSLDIPENANAHAIKRSTAGAGTTTFQLCFSNPLRDQFQLKGDVDSKTFTTFSDSVEGEPAYIKDNGQVFDGKTQVQNGFQDAVDLPAVDGGDGWGTGLTDYPIALFDNPVTGKTFIMTRNSSNVCFTGQLLGTPGSEDIEDTKHSAGSLIFQDDMVVTYVPSEDAFLMHWAEVEGSSNTTRKIRGIKFDPSTNVPTVSAVLTLATGGDNGWGDTILDPISGKPTVAYTTGTNVEMAVITMTAEVPVIETPSVLSSTTGQQDAGPKMAYDVVNDRYIFTYYNSNNFIASATRSGNTFTNGGNLVALGTGSRPQAMYYNESTETLIVAVSSTTGSNTSLRLYDLSGGGFSLGTIYSTMADNNYTLPMAMSFVYNPITDRLFIYVDNDSTGVSYHELSDITSTTLTLGAQVDYAGGPAFNQLSATIYSSQYGGSVSTRYQNSNTIIVSNTGAAQATDEDLRIGVYGETDTAGNPVSVVLKGPIAEEYTGLTPANKLYVQPDKTVSTTETDNLLGIVLSSTEVLLSSGAGGGSSTAADTTYDNTVSGLTADNVKSAIDEVEGRVDTLESSSHAALTLDTAADVTEQAANIVGQELELLKATVSTDGVMSSEDKTKLDNIETSADVTDATNVDAAGAVMESDYDANTILAATTDDTPAPLTVGASTFIGRKSTGNISAMTPAEARTELNVEDNSTADQTDSEIETAYNNQVQAASQIEMEAGTETAIRRMTPQRVSQAIDYNDWQVLDLALTGTNVNVVDAPGYNSAFKKVIIRLTGSISNSTTITMPAVTSTIRFIEIKDAEGNATTSPEYTLSIIPDGSDNIDETSGLTNAFELDADYQSQTFRSSFSNTKWEA